MSRKQIGKTGRLFRVEWNNPYTEPPDGAPRILAEMFVPHEAGAGSQTPAEIEAFPYSLGGGYGVRSSHVSPPPGQLSKESLATVRQKRIARRVNAKVPMFSEHFIQEEIARKPDYYQGVTDPDIEGRRLARIQKESADYKDYFSRPNQLVVFGREPEACRRRAEQLWRETKTVRERLRSKVD